MAVPALKRKLTYKAWRRGTRELDLMVGPVVEHILKFLPLNMFELLDEFLNEEDYKLQHWLTHTKNIPEKYLPLFNKINHKLFPWLQ